MGRKKKKSKKFMIIYFAIFVAVFLGMQQFGIISVDFNSILSLPAEGISSENIELFFCPEHDCETEFAEFIESAKTSLDCAIYDVDSVPIANAFLSLQNKGINARIYSDDDRAEKSDVAEELIEKGLMKLDERSALMHNKFCIKDGNTVWIGSMNATDRGTKQNNNNVLKIESAKLAEIFSEEFEELWRRDHGKKSPTTDPNQLDGFEVYFCPEDKCAESLLKEIRNAKKSIECMFFSLTLDEAGDAFLEASEKLDVKIVFEKTQISQYSEHSKFEGTNIETVIDKNPTAMHNKFCIFDGEKVLTGSMNPSSNSTERNDESVIIIENKEIAEAYQEYFNEKFEEWN